jgi:thiosulfate/3-mercaptopyruvate sulfurtransferase
MKKLISLIFIATSLSFAITDGYKDNNILISPEEAVKLIGKPNVMFVSGDSEDVYKLGHIKGSVEMYAHHLHHSDTMGNMHCDPLFRCIDDAEVYIGSKGIDNDTMVIAYDDYKGPNATGVYHFFYSYGHKNVKVLNGGRTAIAKLDPNKPVYDKARKTWKKAKKVAKKLKKKLRKAKKAFKAGDITEEEYSSLKAELKEAKAKSKELKAKVDEVAETLLVVKGEEEVEAKTYHIDPAKVDTTFVATIEEIKKASDDIVKHGDASKYRIVDARSMIEIIGQRKMDNVARGGHIPGSKFLEWKHISDPDNKRCFRDKETLEATFSKFNISKDNTVYAYCQVGTGRGSEIITALQLLGYKNVKIFTGSWDSWGNDMNLPIKR